jgi:hypothetical protein
MSDETKKPETETPHKVTVTGLELRKRYMMDAAKARLRERFGAETGEGVLAAITARARTQSLPGYTPPSDEPSNEPSDKTSTTEPVEHPLRSAPPQTGSEHDRKSR